MLSTLSHWLAALTWCPGVRPEILLALVRIPLVPAPVPYLLTFPHFPSFFTMFVCFVKEIPNAVCNCHMAYFFLQLCLIVHLCWMVCSIIIPILFIQYVFHRIMYFQTNWVHTLSHIYILDPSDPITYLTDFHFL